MLPATSGKNGPMGIGIRSSTTMIPATAGKLGLWVLSIISSSATSLLAHLYGTAQARPPSLCTERGPLRARGGAQTALPPAPLLWWRLERAAL